MSNNVTMGTQTAKNLMKCEKVSIRTKSPINIEVGARR